MEYIERQGLAERGRCDGFLHASSCRVQAVVVFFFLDFLTDK
jgi:hypothetical protein